MAYLLNHNAEVFTFFFRRGFVLCQGAGDPYDQKQNGDLGKKHTQKTDRQYPNHTQALHRAGLQRNTHCSKGGKGQQNNE